MKTMINLRENHQSTTIKILASYIAAVLLMWFFHHYQFMVNVSESLPYRYWIVALKKLPQRGDYVCFRLPSALTKEYGFSKTVTLTKQVLGVFGDTVTQKGRDFYINNQYVGSAKTHSLEGEVLTLGPSGLIKPGYYYVGSEHPDSFDSRYEKMGWVHQTQLVGVAYPLW